MRPAGGGVIMREILFKAKTGYNGEWVEGDLIHYESGEVAILERPFSKYGYEAGEIIRRTNVMPNTICQYTGLTDKNGNKIWENDVVKWIGRTHKVVFYESMCSFVLVSSSGLWVHMEMNYGDKLECFDYEVIGNVFDNPELLEG